MKKITSIFILNFCTVCTVIILLSNCKPADNSKKLLIQALKNKDYATAAFAYNSLLLADTNNIEYKDSLARIYIKSGNYEGGVRLGEQVMAKQPKNNKLLELVAIGNNRLGRIDKAIANFNILFVASQDYTYLYKIAGMCFDNQKFGQADSLADIMIAKADTTKRITVQLPNGQDQTVPILAACYNMKGAILTELVDITGEVANINKAIPYFNKALEIYPQFMFPQLYLRNIKQALSGYK